MIKNAPAKLKNLSNLPYENRALVTRWMSEFYWGCERVGYLPLAAGMFSELNRRRQRPQKEHNDAMFRLSLTMTCLHRVFS